MVHDLPAVSRCGPARRSRSSRHQWSRTRLRVRTTSTAPSWIAPLVLGGNSCGIVLCDGHTLVLPRSNRADSVNAEWSVSWLVGQPWLCISPRQPGAVPIAVPERRVTEEAPVPSGGDPWEDERWRGVKARSRAMPGCSRTPANEWRAIMSDTAEPATVPDPR